MESIVNTHLNVGLEKPVKILHITDVHLTFADQTDTDEHKALMARRVETFKKEANYPPHTPTEYFQEAIETAEKLGALLINTGDTMDIHTKGNINEFLRIADGKDMMFTPGGHEHQNICRRTMEEEYPYFETIRPKLKAAFSKYDMDFSSRIINGLNIVCADNSLDYYSPITLARFKSELEKGLPIIVFSHDPIWDEMLYHTKPYHPNVRLTPEDYKASHEMINLLKNHPLVITTFAGHGHFNEEREIEGKTHYMTAGLFKGICRYIEID